MKRSWNWDFEERPHDPAREQPSEDGDIGPTAPSRATLHRRRMIAGLVCAILLATAVAIEISSHHGSAGASQRAPGTPHAASAKPIQPSPDALERGMQAVAGVLAYTPFVRDGSEHAREIALTFDDGPGPYTPQILEVLERMHVHATFFEIGEMLRYFSASAAREIRDGDVIGDHTETHPEMAKLSAHDQREELIEQIARIELLGGPRPDLFRPPYGSFDATTMRQLHRLHLLMVLWSADTQDYLRPGVATILARALAGAKPGAIILMHDAGGDRSETVAALPSVIRELRARGFRLVTVPQLLADDPPPAGEPLPPNLSGD
jgi:peptidoglycan/xylan/chitin deacetylase (PgdA/CDA1 family)